MRLPLEIVAVFIFKLCMGLPGLREVECRARSESDHFFWVKIKAACTEFEHRP